MIVCASESHICEIKVFAGKFVEDMILTNVALSPDSQYFRHVLCVRASPSYFDLHSTTNAQA